MDKPKPGTPGTDSSKVRAYIALGLVVLAAVLLVVWLVSDDDDGSSDGKFGAAAEIVSTDTLRDAADDRDTPIYWVGERQGAELELSEPDAGRVYVRYLTDGAKAGDERPAFLTIGTYETDNPIGELRRQGKEPDGVLGTAPGGATVFFSRTQPGSVYVAFPGVDAQIEVYDPRFRQALQLVNSGQVVPVD